MDGLFEIPEHVDGAPASARAAGRSAPTRTPRRRSPCACVRARSTSWSGQEQLRAPGSPLRQLIEGDQSMSLLLWGPPGTGKTTIASIVSQQTDAALRRGLGGRGRRQGGARGDRRRPLRAGARRAARRCCSSTRCTGSARRSRTRCCPGVENRWVTLVAATTENPFFSVISPLLSRSLLLRLRVADRRRHRRGRRPGARPTSAGWAATVRARRRTRGPTSCAWPAVTPAGR